jgi:hypothetical protein
MIGGKLMTSLLLGMSACNERDGAHSPDQSLADIDTRVNLARHCVRCVPREGYRLFSSVTQWCWRLTDKQGTVCLPAASRDRLG